MSVGVTYWVALAAALAVVRVKAIARLRVLALVGVPVVVDPDVVLLLRLARRVTLLSTLDDEVAELESVLVAALTRALAMREVVHLGRVAGDLPDLERHTARERVSELCEVVTLFLDRVRLVALFERDSVAREFVIGTLEELDSDINRTGSVNVTTGTIGEVFLVEGIKGEAALGITSFPVA